VSQISNFDQENQNHDDESVSEGMIGGGFGPKDSSLNQKIKPHKKRESGGSSSIMSRARPGSTSSAGHSGKG